MQRDYWSAPNGAVASIALDWPEAKTCSGWVSILDDLDRIRDASECLASELESEGMGDPLLREPLTWMIVVRYGRCFAQGVGRGAMLDEAVVAKRLSGDLLLLHSGLLERRNQTFAHAGKQCEHTVVLHLVEEAEGSRFLLSPDFTAAGEIIDPGQARLIAELATEVAKVAGELLDRARSRIQKRVEAEKDQLLRMLQERKRKFATSQQAALNMMRGTSNCD